MKIDFGCGKNKREGFEGVDVIAFEGVDHVFNVGSEPFPFEDNSIEEAHASHFVEHLEPNERIHFFNELFRCMKHGAQITVIVPHWSSSRAYGDLTHKWPPVVEFFWFYLNQEWRKVNAPHLDLELSKFGFSCHFEGTWGYSPFAGFQGRSDGFMQFAMNHYLEARQDMIATLTCKKE
jgi:hypothetical protein